eukprot:1161141-Pelagomonas_calceolata.AAC.4
MLKASVVRAKLEGLAQHCLFLCKLRHQIDHGAGCSAYALCSPLLMSGCSANVNKCSYSACVCVCAALLVPGQNGIPKQTHEH